MAGKAAKKGTPEAGSGLLEWVKGYLRRRRNRAAGPINLEGDTDRG